MKTNKEISEAIGKETVSAMTVNDSRGQGSSTTRNRQIIERDLMQAVEVGADCGREAIVLIAGANPIRDKKYRPKGTRATGCWRKAGDDARRRQRCMPLPKAELGNASFHLALLQTPLFMQRAILA